MKRNIGKFAANVAAAGVLLGAAVVFADDQQNQQSGASSTDQSQQAGQSSSATSPSSSDQSSPSATGGGGAISAEAREKAQAKVAEIAQDPQLFIKVAYEENLSEVKAGQLAQQKAQSQQCKDFAQSLVQDHQQALDQLKKLADQKNVQVSDQLDPRRQRMIDELSSLSGADFDKRFMNQQIRAHKRAIALYQQAAQSNTDAEVKQFAQQNVAGLQHHLQMAEQQGGISEPAGASSSKDSKDQGSSSQPQQGQSGASSSSPSSPDQSAQPGQSGQPSSPSQPDQSQPSPKSYFGQLLFWAPDSEDGHFKMKAGEKVPSYRKIARDIFCTRVGCYKVIVHSTPLINRIARKLCPANELRAPLPRT